jgi:hypothetical protein
LRQSDEEFAYHTVKMPPCIGFARRETDQSNRIVAPSDAAMLVHFLGTEERRDQRLKDYAQIILD